MWNGKVESKRGKSGYVIWSLAYTAFSIRTNHEVGEDWRTLRFLCVSVCVNNSVLFAPRPYHFEIGAEPPLPYSTVLATKPVGTVCIMSRQGKSGVFEHNLGKIFIKAIGMSLFFSKGSLFLLVCKIFIKVDHCLLCSSYIDLLTSNIGFCFRCITLPKTVQCVFPNVILL